MVNVKFHFIQIGSAFDKKPVFQVGNIISINVGIAL